MVTLLLSDNPALAEQLRQLMQHMGYECPVQNVLGFEQLGSVSTRLSDPKVITIVLLGKNVSTALRTISQLRVQTSGLIVAIGTKDAEVILNAVHAGADDYVDELAIEHDLPRTISRQCIARGISSPHGQLVLVVAGSGGCGRSQIATNLAVSAAQLQQRSCLIELDTSGGNCAAMLALKPRHTIFDLYRHSEKLDRKTLEKTLMVHESGVSLLPGPNEIARPDAIQGDFIERLIRIARPMFPQVVVDFQDLWNVDALKRLTVHSPRFLMVTRLDFNAVCNTSRALHHLERLGIARERIQVVANREGEPGGVAIRKVEQILALQITHQLADDPRTIHRAINSGVPYVIETPQAPLSRQMTALAEAITGIHRQTAQSPEAKAPVNSSGVRASLQNLLNIRSMLSRLA